MKNYHLYLDETGDFGNEKKLNAIGGFLVPESNSFLGSQQKDILKRWNEQLRTKLIESDCGITAIALREGEALLREEGKDAEACPPFSYIFDHCSQNKSNPVRTKAQAFVLENIIQIVKEHAGRIILFDDPEAHCLIDNTTNYLSVMAVGLFRLYNRLREEHPGEQVVLHVHAAQRKNVTYHDEEKRFLVSPFYEEGQKNIIRRWYINQLTNLIFLRGGEDALGLPGFKESLKSFEIMLPEHGAEHPATVLCDYICNSRYHQDKEPVYAELLRDAEVFDVFKRDSLDEKDFSIEHMKENHGWSGGLKKLISRSFEDAGQTADFFAAMNADEGFRQERPAEEIVSYLKGFVEMRTNMAEWVKRLNITAEKVEPMEPGARALLRCNLYLFINALATHMGDQSAARNAALLFKNTLPDIDGAEKRDDLLCLHANRQIIDCIDSFDYERAEKFYNIAEAYYAADTSAGETLALELFELLGPEDGDGMLYLPYPEYGKLIGSYSQLLSHRIHTSEGDAREKAVAEAERILPDMEKYFISAVDKVRARQNACDLLADMGRFDEALVKLYTATLPDEPVPEDCAARCAGILNNCGSRGEKNHFTYLHYTRLMHRMFAAGDPEAETLLSALLNGEPFKKDKVKVADVHPDVVSLWHVAASVACSGRTSAKEKAEAWNAMEAAATMLRGKNSSVFTAIAIGILAEMLRLDRKKIAAMDAKTRASALRKMRECYRDEFLKYANTRNPFKELMESLPKESTNMPERVLAGIAQKIAY